MQNLVDVLHALAELGPWGCLGLALLIVMLSLPVLLQRYRVQHAVAVSAMRPDQAAIYRDTAGPGPARHTLLMLAVVLGAALLAGIGSGRLFARVQLSKSCSTDTDCAAGETCISRTCTQRCESPRSTFDVDQRPRGLPVYQIRSSQ